MKSFQLFGIGTLLALAVCLAGCTNPKPNPVQAAPKFRDGIALDTNATQIAPADLPYRVSHHWTIPAGRTVTILPGTEIMFDSLWWVDVQGRIEAVGTAEEPIVFTTAYLNPKFGQWRGFKLRHSPDGESRFEHCIFSWGAYYDTDTLKVDPVEGAPVIEAFAFRGMLCVRNSSPVIERCIVISNQNNAVSLSGPNCAPRIRYNILTDNDASAVRADTLVPIADYVGEAGKPDVSYNCVADNSSALFVYGFDSTRFGRRLKINANRDSVDFFYNLDLSPMMRDPVSRDFTLESCSPCVDAGPVGVDLDFDSTRADMGSNPYVQVRGELRGLLEDDTLRAAIAYRMSCDCKVDSGRTLYIEPGTHIEAVELYTLTVVGRVVMAGSEGARIRFEAVDQWGGIQITNFDTLAEPSRLEYVDLVNYRQLNVAKAGTRFDHCLFEGGFLYGMRVATYATDESDTVSVQSCTFQSCGENALVADTSAVTVRNTVVAGSAGRGITLHSPGAAAVTNCLIRGNGSSGLVLENFASPPVINNTIVQNGYYGIHLLNNCHPAMLNNIIVANQRYGVYAQFSSAPTLQYNDVWGHSMATDTGTANTDYVPATLARSSSISGDPLFRASDDWQLTDGSPCVNAGDPSPEFNDPDGSRNDMGAYGGPAASRGVGAVRLRGPVAYRLASK
jgi:parallel beta-helix repeat protein